MIAWRAGEEGEPRFLLITSRDTGRWVVPRGNPIGGMAPHLSAAQEAWEEAGVTGRASGRPAGSYRYEKRKRGGAVPARVTLFPLEVEAEHDDWPEKAERRRRWFGKADAAAAVDEPGLARLLLGFDPAGSG